MRRDMRTKGGRHSTSCGTSVAHFRALVAHPGTLRSGVEVSLRDAKVLGERTHQGEIFGVQSAETGLERFEAVYRAHEHDQLLIVADYGRRVRRRLACKPHFQQPGVEGLQSRDEGEAGLET